MGRVSDAKQRILYSAGELMSARGYTDVSVNEICAHAGVKKGSFYYFFPSKRDLLLGVIDAYGESYRKMFEDAMNADLKPLGRIQRLFQLVYQSSDSNRKASGCVEGCRVGNLAAELSTRDALVRQKLGQLFEEWQGYIENALSEAMAAGDIPRTNAADTAQSILAYLEGLILLAKTDNDPKLVKQLADGALRLAGVVPPNQFQRKS